MYQCICRCYNIIEEMGEYESLKPVIVMILLQFSYSAVALSTRAALLQGMSPRIFVVYRQAIATLVIAPLAFFSRYLHQQSVNLYRPQESSFFWINFLDLFLCRSKTIKRSLGLRSFSLIFLASLIGYTDSFQRQIIVSYAVYVTLFCVYYKSQGHSEPERIFRGIVPSLIFHGKCNVESTPCCHLCDCTLCRVQLLNHSLRWTVLLSFWISSNV